MTPTERRSRSKPSILSPPNETETETRAHKHLNRECRTLRTHIARRKVHRHSLRASALFQLAHVGLVRRRAARFQPRELDRVRVVPSTFSLTKNVIVRTFSNALAASTSTNPSSSRSFSQSIVCVGFFRLAFSNDTGVAALTKTRRSLSRARVRPFHLIFHPTHAHSTNTNVFHEFHPHDELLVVVRAQRQRLHVAFPARQRPLVQSVSRSAFRHSTPRGSIKSTRSIVDDISADVDASSIASIATESDE